ncbi:DUF1289 domain-containing protein [Pikeienuella piscinae]|uniref:DUF1289 domain-containing protein n=1 Tax=Pikeienuella piscinae TaxID=2748098 RepID=A0A7L5BTA0_9RHOB|nr:DUF1289 domain-containing protein [Pikeienuella piscinae]QIE55140.1 DUF1289 domain-containing protein [Pikeienuella piscinae]
MSTPESRRVWRRDEVESPCRNICVIHPETGLCIGCYRTGAEIADWSRLTHEERRAVILELPTRAPQLTRRPRRGRAARLNDGG